MVTIREVARESGVSAATVSHVLNGTRRVEPETAARVRAAIEKLGYRPLREYDRYGLRGIRLAGYFAHGTGMCACADFFGLLEQRLAAQLDTLLGEDGQVVSKTASAVVEGEVLTVTLRAECREEIGTFVPWTSEP